MESWSYKFGQDQSKKTDGGSPVTRAGGKILDHLVFGAPLLDIYMRERDPFQSVPSVPVSYAPARGSASVPTLRASLSWWIYPFEVWEPAATLSVEGAAGRFRPAILAQLLVLGFIEWPTLGYGQPS